ncbi:MAG: outer membrane protein assembly factor BamB [Candidatus Latescibacterota bacterium]
MSALKAVRDRWAIGLWLWLCIAMPIHAQQDHLFGLDARFSQIVRFDLSTGAELARFPSPVLCRTEGACGMAYSGHSLYMVDATDPDGQIYELNAEDGTIWHSIPAPPGRIDGLAYEAGVLYALSFSADIIYALDSFDGRVLRELVPGVDLVGGLGVAGHRLYASRIRPPAIFSIDGESGQILGEWASPARVPTGIAVLGQRLFVGDFSSQRLLELNAQSGELVGEVANGIGNLAALAAGRADAIVPYHIRLGRATEELRADGLVQLSLHMGLYDDTGRLLQTNDYSEITVVISGGVELQAVAKTVGGLATVGFALEPGVNLVAEVQLSGLPPARLELRVVSPVVRVVLEFNEDAREKGLIEVKANLIDATDNPALNDTSEVSFALLSGPAVLVGTAVVSARDGVARTWLRTDGRNADIRVETRVRSIVAVAALHTGKIGAVGPGQDGLTLSAGQVAGRDDIPPSPVTGLSARSMGQGQVDISWQLAPEDGVRYWVPFGEGFIARDGIEGYRLLRADAGGLFAEVAVLERGTSSFTDSVDPLGGPYVYQIVVADADNWRIAKIAAGTVADAARTVVMVAVGIDADGAEVRGLFDDDLDVDFDDFFLFIDTFGTSFSASGFDGRFDLDGDGAVGLDDFFIFADHFGKEVVRR